MDDMKSTDNSMILTQFLVTLLEKSAPDLLKFGDDIPTIEKACRISLSQLQADANTLVKVSVVERERERKRKREKEKEKEKERKRKIKKER